MTFPQNSRRCWTFLSLWSLLALAAPQLLWACPAMGTMSSTPHSTCCCQKKLSSDLSSTSSSTSQAQTESATKMCCRKVPLPASDTSDENGKVALLSNRNLAASIEYFLLPSHPAVLSSLEKFELQPSSVAFFPPTSFALNSQQTPRLSLGRSPPF